MLHHLASRRRNRFPSFGRARGIAALEYSLILMFMGITMVRITHIVIDLLPIYYYKGLLGIITQATP